MTHPDFLAVAKTTIAEVIRDLGVANSRELYAQVAGLLEREDYEAIVAALVAEGLVRVEGDWLEWVRFVSADGGPRDVTCETAYGATFRFGTAVRVF